MDSNAMGIGAGLNLGQLGTPSGLGPNKSLSGLDSFNSSYQISNKNQS